MARTADCGITFERRYALKTMLGAFAVLAFVREARTIGAPRPTNVKRWLEGQRGIAEDLAEGRMRGQQWARSVRDLARAVDVRELMAFVASQQITPAGKPFANDPRKRFVRFIDEAGQPQRLAYGAALFDFEPHNVVTPHGHKHMVSAHLVVEGRLRVRNFDRVGDVDGAMLLRATRDYLAAPGQVSTMCSQEDNIHWFVPDGIRATTFDVVISGLDAGAPDHLIQAVDRLRATARADGVLETPIISFEEASRRYTAHV